MKDENETTRKEVLKMNSETEKECLHKLQRYFLFIFIWVFYLSKIWSVNSYLEKTQKMLDEVKELISKNMEYLEETTDQFCQLKKEADKLIR